MCSLSTCSGVGYRFDQYDGLNNLSCDFISNRLAIPFDTIANVREHDNDCDNGKRHQKSSFEIAASLFDFISNRIVYMVVYCMVYASMVNVCMRSGAQKLTDVDCAAVHTQHKT